MQDIKIIIDDIDYDTEDIFYCVNCNHFISNDRYDQGSYCNFKKNNVGTTAESVICKNFEILL